MQNPELVLMSCCAPCSCDAIRQLKEQGENFVVLFFNPNIFPVAEYQKRLREQIEFCESLGVQFEAGGYDHSAWLSCIKGLEYNRERGERCSKCFAHRFAFGAEWAKSHGATAITSVFGVSPHKSQSQVDAAAEGALKNTGILYKKFDFNYKPVATLYKQKYCGCEFSETFNG